MKAIIMAGGQGTRLRPLTCNVPKPMLPIMEKPVMQYIIELLRENDIKDIGVTLQYLPDEVINYFGNGKDFGVNMNYFIEETPLGTAGSVKNAEKFLDDTFIVISGDALTDIDLSEAISYHKKKKAIATLVLKEVPVPLEYGVVVTDKDGRVTGFLEKPSWSEVFSDKANTGIYILEPEVFDYYEKNQQFDFSNDLFPILLKNHKPIYGYTSNGYWCDIGSIEQFMKSQFDILNGIVRVNIKGERHREGVWIGENCTISPHAVIVPPVYIGSNTKIYNNAEVGPYTIFGKNNIVSSRATIKRSIIFDNCYMGNNVEVRGSVLCRKVQMENSSSSFEEAAIGDETLIGHRAVIKPGVKIWPNKVISNSAVVKTNIIWGGKFSKALFGRCGISGEVNVDITPEFVSKLGSAYGSLLKLDSKVAISCSDDGAAQMFKYSIATGLMSIGIEVYDLKRMSLSMTRQATVFFGVHGSIHISISKEDNQKVNIVFMDRDGLNITKTLERKIENSFLREDFRRTKTDSFKYIKHLNDCVEYYERQIINQLSINKIRSQRYKVVFASRNNILIKVMQHIFMELGVSYKIYDQPRDIIGLSKEVELNNANFGVYISDESSSAIFVDEKGSIIREQNYDALKTLIMLNVTKMKTVAAPVNQSSAVEQVAKMYGAKFIRTKISQRAVLDAYLKNESIIRKREIINGYLLTLDAVAVLMHALNIMANSNISLSNIMSKIPKYYMEKIDVACPWNKKGKVMRSLIENGPVSSIELIEGVKFKFDDLWALVLPDSDEPLCRIYAESRNEEETEKISQKLAKDIQDIINEIAVTEN